MKTSTRRTLIIVGVIVLVILAFVLAYELTRPTEIVFSGAEDSFESLLANGQIQAIYIEGNYTVKIKRTGDSAFKYFVNIDSRVAFSDKLKEYKAANLLDNVIVQYDNPSSGSLLSSIIVPIVLYALLFGVFFIIIRKSAGAQGQAMNFGKTKANQVRDIKVRFSDVAGAEEEKQELQEIVDFLKHPKKYTDIGARIPRGVLLVGPPGTGKTLFAKAVAGEANVPFFSISGSDFVEMFVGVGASRVRDLFEQAKKNMPCIIFIDEIDAVGRQRGAGLGGGNDEREQTLNQLLVQMDGFEASSSIIVMAATNRADILDPALM